MKLYTALLALAALATPHTVRAAYVVPAIPSNIPDVVVGAGTAAPTLSAQVIGEDGSVADVRPTLPATQELVTVAPTWLVLTDTCVYNCANKTPNMPAIPAWYCRPFPYPKPDEACPKGYLYTAKRASVAYKKKRDEQLAAARKLLDEQAAAAAEANPPLGAQVIDSPPTAAAPGPGTWFAHIGRCEASCLIAASRLVVPYVYCTSPAPAADVYCPNGYTYTPTPVL